MCGRVRSTTEETVHWNYVDVMLKHLKQLSSVVTSCANMQTVSTGFCLLFIIKCVNVVSDVFAA